MSFVHLHLHSEYSLLSSTCRIGKTFEKAKEMGMPAVAVTDNGSMYGAFRAFVKGKETGVNPILGVDAFKASNSRLDRPDGDDHDRVVLLSKDLVGYRNLMKMITRANLEGVHKKPRIDFELLEEYREGLIVLSGSINGEIPQLILKNNVTKAEEVALKYRELFGNDFYFEIQRHKDLADQEVVNRELIRLSRKHAIPLVATNDVHYLNPDDAYAQEILLCIQTGRAIFERDRPLTMIDHPDYYFRSPEEMKELFADFPEAIDNTLKIAEQCSVPVPHGKLLVPQYPIPTGQTSPDYLRELVMKNRQRAMLPTITDEDIIKRVDYELSIIIDKGYADYFLITADFVVWAKDNGIAVGPGRGSAAGSLVSYILRIIEVNPLEYGLPFERFLNPGRPSPPDIDIDFADVRRDEVLNYVRAKYGDDHVAQMITFGSMEPKMAVRDVSRALGLTYAQGDRVAKMIPVGKQGAHITIDQAMEESEMLKNAYMQEEDIRKVIDITRKVEKLPRHTSVHASGVIISDRSLPEYVPLQKDDKAGRIITQFDMYCLDLNAVSENNAVGLLKFDFLGLRNLTILENALIFVKEQKGLSIKIAEVPLDDQPTYDLMGRGETIGVFQLESPGMRRLAKDLKPSRLSDIIAMVALYRPGPMELIPTFIKGKQDPSKVRYLDQSLKPILGETYGILVYQEQVMDIAHRLAGYTMGDADNLRRAMGKKKIEAMLKEKKKFIDGALKKGLTAKVADEIFGFMEKFAAYGFNKPHSACYALIAYWTAYMKANHPVEFMTALLTAEMQGAAGPAKEEKMAQAIEECKRMNITVMPPHVNRSKRDFSIEDGNIRFGFSAVKNVGSAAIDSILEARKEKPFQSFTDFMTRVDLRRVNKKTLESLIKASTFEEFGNRATLMANFPQMVKDINSKKEQDEKGQFELFFDGASEKNLDDHFETLPEFPETEIIRMEKEVLGFLITRNPLDRFREIIATKVNKLVGDISPEDKDKLFIMAGNITSLKAIKTKKDNSDMAFFNLTDDSGSIEVIAFPKTYKALRSVLGVDRIILMKGKVNVREDRVSVLLEKAVDLERMASH